MKNAKALAAALTGHGYRLQSGGTDNHLMLVDLRARNAEFTGADAEKALEAAGIISNKNAILNDPRPPKVTSGVRLGTPAVTTRGLKEADMATVADFIDRAIARQGRRRRAGEDSRRSRRVLQEVPDAALTAAERGVVMTVMEMPSPPRVRRRRLRPDPGRGIVLYGVSWRAYESLLKEVGDGHVRLTYDDGALEINLPGKRHEKYKNVLGRMIELMSLERDIPISSYGEATMKKKRARKGAEPDESYYVQNEPKVRGRIEFASKSYPPPDLVVEVDISSHSIAKEPIYAALGVPEVWRFDGTRLQSLQRNAKGEYERARTASPLRS